MYVGFWSALIRWMAHQEAKERSSGPGMTLYADKLRYETDEIATLTARVVGTGGRTPTAAEVKAEVTGPGGHTDTLRLAGVPGDPSTFQTQVPVRAAGLYRVQASAAEAGVPLGTAELRFQVGRENQEFDRLDLNEAGLMALAERTGGEYASLSEADELVDRMRAAQALRRRPVSIPRTWRGAGMMTTMFVLVVLLLSVEWFLRKRIQLA